MISKTSIGYAFLEVSFHVKFIQTILYGTKGVGFSQDLYYSEQILLPQIRACLYTETLLILSLHLDILTIFHVTYGLHFEAHNTFSLHPKVEFSREEQYKGNQRENNYCFSIGLLYYIIISMNVRGCRFPQSGLFVKYYL